MNKDHNECIEQKMTYEQYRAQWRLNPVHAVTEEFYRRSYSRYWGTVAAQYWAQLNAVMGANHHKTYVPKRTYTSVEGQ